MIAKVTTGRAFAGLARYLETGRDADNTDRVAWTETRNLPTDDSRTATSLMRVTAAESVRTEKPVYHIALSFDPEDAIDRTTMVQVADGLMRDLRLQDHQALFVAHGDTRHPHLHLMINRVHPDTYRAWHAGKDYVQIERSLRRQERELGLRAVPGHHYRVEEQEPLDPTSERGGDLTRPAERSAPADGHGNPPAERTPHDRSAPEPEPSARAEAHREHTAQRSTGEQNTHASGREAAANGTGAEPSQSGQAAPEASRSRDVDATRPDGPRAGRTDAERSRNNALDPRLGAVRQTISRLEHRTQLEQARQTARDGLDRARVRLILPNSHRAHARTASRQFRAALAEVYRDPVTARRAFHAEAKQIGDPAAATELAHRPQRFGQLHGTQVGPVQSPARVAALKAVPKLEHLGGAHLRDVREAWASRAEYREARGTGRRLEREIQTLDHELARTPGRAQLERKLARQIRGLQPPEHQRLLRSLPIPHRKVLSAATMVAREFAREQGQER